MIVYSTSSARRYISLRNYNLQLGCVQTDATLLTSNSQHCWMLHVASICTPYYMLLDVVAQSLKPVKLLAQWKRTQHCWLTTPNIVGSCCARLHVALQLQFTVHCICLRLISFGYL